MSMETISFKQKLSTLLPLLIITLICVVSIFVLHGITKDKIEINKQKATLEVINQVIPLEYDNDLFTDKIELTVPSSINNTNRIMAYRARLGNKPIAIGIMPVLTKGYNGNISLLIGLSYEGQLTGVKILQHNETEGFGDQAHQDKTGWLKNFNNASLANQKEKWAITKDGGEFDQLSGATITSRSIINSIYKTLVFYTENRDVFYANQ